MGMSARSIQMFKTVYAVSAAMPIGEGPSTAAKSLQYRFMRPATGWSRFTRCRLKRHSIPASSQCA